MEKTALSLGLPRTNCYLSRTRRALIGADTPRTRGAKAMRLTDAAVRRLPAPQRGNKVHYDDELASFGCRITCGGAKAFVVNYRVKGSGRERRITIGKYPAWQVKAARDEAERLRRLIDSGGDPLGDIEDQRAAPTMADLVRR